MVYNRRTYSLSSNLPICSQRENRMRAFDDRGPRGTLIRRSSIVQNSHYIKSTLLPLDLKKIPKILADHVKVRNSPSPGSDSRTILTESTIPDNASLSLLGAMMTVLSTPMI